VQWVVQRVQRAQWCREGAELRCILGVHTLTCTLANSSDWLIAKVSATCA